MKRDLVAVLEEATARSAIASWRGEPASLVSDNGLAAVLVQASRKPNLFARFSRNPKPVVAALVARQQLYEHLLAVGDLLTVQPGTSVVEPDIVPFLRANAAVLSNSLADHTGQVQYQLMISWEPAHALRRFAKAPELAGTGIASGAERLRARLGREFAALLDRAILDRIDLPSDGVETLLNSALLIDRCSLPALDRALEDIDATWSEGLKLKLTGPLPPLSFAQVKVHSFGPTEQSAALATLGLNAGIDRLSSTRTTDIDRAFRDRVKSSHPDGTSVAVDMTPLVAARNVLKRAKAAAACLGEPLPTSLLLAEICRDTVASTHGTKTSAPNFEPVS